jgi:hypothetical protein
MSNILIFSRSHFHILGWSGRCCLPAQVWAQARILHEVYRRPIIASLAVPSILFLHPSVLVIRILPSFYYY